jgi:hypothetical protein
MAFIQSTPSSDFCTTKQACAYYCLSPSIARHPFGVQSYFGEVDSWAACNPGFLL